MLRLLQTCIMVTTLFSCAQAIVNERPQPPTQDRTLEQVEIKNILDGKQDLSVHCKSGDDDFGVHNLSYNATYSLSFRRNFRGTTLIECGFSWDWGKQSHHTDIYTPEGPNCRAPNKCLWYIIPSGPCLSHSNSFEYRCFPWDK
uniref:S-protein homolog n=1 Tax=Humulus scandens TaxID=228586 RepID=A0A6J3WUY4_HUMSC|nr:Hum s 3 allergen [Humulus scandens]